MKIIEFYLRHSDKKVLRLEKFCIVLFFSKCADKKQQMVLAFAEGSY